MSDCLKDFEYYSLIHNSYVYGEIVGIQEENSYILKNKKDGTEEICESKNIRKITNISSIPLNDGICEYIKNDDEFLEVEIKEQKGKFCILETEDEEGNQSTFLSRENQIRYIECIPIEDFITDKYNNVILDMPPGLESWIGSERYEDVIKNLKGEESNGETESPSKLFLACYPSDSPKFLRVFCDNDKKDIAKLLLTTAMEREKKLTSINQDKENSKKQLEDVQKKNQSFYINQKYIGLIIGKEGANIKNLKSKYNVNITIDSKKTKDKNMSKVIITGDDGNNVEACSKEINIVERIFELPENSVADFKKRTNKIIEEYNIKFFFISNEEKKDDNGKVYKAPNVSITGNNENIEKLYHNEIKDYGKYNNNNYGSYKYPSNTYNRQRNYGYNYYNYNKGYNNNYY
jgi:hypothetical protein